MIKIKTKNLIIALFVLLCASLAEGGDVIVKNGELTAFGNITTAAYYSGNGIALTNIPWNYNQTLNLNLAQYLSTFNTTYNSHVNNASAHTPYNGSTFNRTYDTKISSQWTNISATNISFTGNATVTNTLRTYQLFVNNKAINDTWAYNQTRYFNLSWNFNQTKWLDYNGFYSTYNSTYAPWAYNQTLSLNLAQYLSTFNSTYNTWAYNQTLNLDYAGFYTDSDTVYNGSTFNATYAAKADYAFGNNNFLGTGDFTGNNSNVTTLTIGNATLYFSQSNYLFLRNKENTSYHNLRLAALYATSLPNAAGNGSGSIGGLTTRWDGIYAEKVLADNVTTNYISAGGRMINDTWAYNQTLGLDYAGFYADTVYNGSTFNATYNTWAYNQTSGLNYWTENSSTQWWKNQTTNINTAWLYNQTLNLNLAQYLSTFNTSYNNHINNASAHTPYNGSTYNNTYNTWAYNQTAGLDYAGFYADSDTVYNGSTFNKTYDTKISSQWTNVSATNISFTGNATVTNTLRTYQLFVNNKAINDTWAYNQTRYFNLSWNFNQTKWLDYNGFYSTYNSTYSPWAYNQTLNLNLAQYLSTFNSTYSLWAYNQTVGLDYAGFYADSDTVYNGSTYNGTYALGIPYAKNIFDQSLNSTSKVNFSRLLVNDSAGGFSILNVGDDLLLPATAVSGFRVMQYTDDNIYVDFKTISGGAIRFRAGEGAGNPYDIYWMDVDPTNGDVNVYSNLNVSKSMNVSQLRVGLAGGDVVAPLEVSRVNDNGIILWLSNGGYGFGFNRSSSTGALSIQGNQEGYNNILLAPGSGNVGIGISDPGAGLHINTSESVYAQFIIGDDPVLNTNGHSGLAVYRVSDGSMYIDTKTKSGGNTNFRTGEGAETGYQRTWMQVDSTNGKVTLPLGLVVGSNSITTSSQFRNLSSTNLIFEGDGPALTINSTSSASAYVRLGTSGGAGAFVVSSGQLYYWDYDGTGRYFLFNGSGSLALGGATSAGGAIDSIGTYDDIVGATNRDLFIDNAGVIGYVSSSQRYKENIQSLTETDINKVYDLMPRKYDRIGEEAKGEIGLIAEEVAKVYPELVSNATKLIKNCPNNESDTCEPYYADSGYPETVQYSKLPVYLLAALKDLKQENELLKSELCKKDKTYAWCT